ncbi:hypothetical protein GGTG_04895 [Gaeumannomyces tritici R3-111a-1]|uniref:Uncharacterized protein n=1 Tax=Gaeumannomyces tritici (strain R3-111a-1) TaxID=644352 RepID=J3NUD9_GAET3|nr:hypothetical protein GGTG_04895 [Gaeumannomyces tritici R3-111a-1]EJT79812.1 hypothetical protein GGTG_04895 [Gaeumannomyces tritici R3-111a-1]
MALDARPPVETHGRSSPPKEGQPRLLESPEQRPSSFLANAVGNNSPNGAGLRFGCFLTRR